MVQQARRRARIPRDLWLSRRGDVDSGNEEESGWLDSPASPPSAKASFAPNIEAIVSADSPSPTSTGFAAILNPEAAKSLDSPSPMSTVIGPGVTSASADPPSPTSTSFPAVLNPVASDSTLPATASPTTSTPTPLPPSSDLTDTQAPMATSARMAMSTQGSDLVTETASLLPGTTQTTIPQSLAPVEPGDQSKKPSNSANDINQQLGPTNPPPPAPNRGVQVGIAVSTIAIVALVVSVGFLFWRWRRNRRRRSQSASGSEEMGRAGAVQKPAKSQSRILDELITAAYAAEEGGPIAGTGSYETPGRSTSLVMPNGFVASEKQQQQRDSLGRSLFLPNGRVTQPSIRKSMASWIRDRNPLKMNPLAHRKSTDSSAPTLSPTTNDAPRVSPAPAAVPAEEQKPGLTPQASFLAVDPYATPSEYRHTRQMELTDGTTSESLYSLYARQSSASARASTAEWWRYTSSNASTQGRARAPAPLEYHAEQPGVRVPRPAAGTAANPTALWVEQQAPWTLDSPN